METTMDCPKDTNPRLWLWLLSAGLTLDAINRDHNGDMPKMRASDGTDHIWSIVYTEWILARWDEWALELGFKVAYGRSAHDNALAAGHTHAEFDAWLLAKVMGGIGAEAKE